MLKLKFILPTTKEESTPSSLLLDFYKGLGWDSRCQKLDVRKIKISRNNYDKLYDTLKAVCSSDELMDLNMFMLQYGPSVEDTIDDTYTIIHKGAIA